MNLTGVVPLSEEMDTAGFFARDPQLFYEIAMVRPVSSLLSLSLPFSL